MHRTLTHTVFLGIIAFLLVTAAPSLAQYEGLVDRIKPAVVLIYVERPGMHDTLAGSGFFIDASGYIMTARHVIEDAQTITVLAQGDKHLTARLVRYSGQYDAAVLKVDGDNYPVLPLGD